MFFLRPRVVIFLIVLALASGTGLYIYYRLNNDQAVQALRQELAIIKTSNATIDASVKAITDLPKLTNQSVSLSDVLNPAKKIKTASTQGQTAVANAKQSVPDLKQAYPQCLKHLPIYKARAAGMRNSRLDNAKLPHGNQVGCRTIPPAILKLLKLTSS